MRSLERYKMIRRVLTAFAIAATLVPAVWVSSARAVPQTIVSLTFDDGRATAYAARPILASHGMHGTFYLNSGLIGSYSFWMTWPQIADLYADGNEIGGHTAYHANLQMTDPREAQREVCDDRVNLLDHGYAPTSFAYPYGAYTSSVESMVQACGYASARTTEYLNGGTVGTPPADPYAIGIGNSSVTLTNLENAVRAAEATGGWVPLAFHDICNGCSSLAISPANFGALLDWLQGESANGVVVQTVAQVTGGPVSLGVSGPAAPAAANGTNGLRNASLETDADGDSAPDCWSFDGYGTNTYAWIRTTDSHSGAYAEKVDVSGYSSGDRYIDMTQDLGACTPSVRPGHRYVLKAWYKSTSPVYFTFFSRDTNLAFNYWTDSGTFGASGGWTQAVYMTPVIPASVTGLSFGLAIAGAGSLTVDDLSIDDASATGSPDTTAPTIALTGPATGATLANQATISATASDNVALDHVDYLVDGQVVGSTVTGNTSLSWNTRTVANGAHTFAARATDTSGNTATSSSASATVANQPLVNLLTNNPSLEAGGNGGAAPDCWQFGGSNTTQNAATYTHTTDAHSGGFAENLNMTSYTAGDRKLVSAQTQACAPAATGGHAYNVSAWYKATGTAWIYIYYRNTSGIWTFLSQSNKPAAAGWTQANLTTGVLPANANKISVGMGLEGLGSLTIDDFSISEAVPPPDTTAPTSAITCNNNGTEGTCGTGYYPGSVLIRLTATDDANGTGVASIRYTTDGSDPTPSNGSTYSGPFNTTGTVKYRGYDFAGNAEAIRTQVIVIDAAAPATSISCNGAPCAATPYNAPVSVTLDATDTGGSGLASTRYTTDGTDPSPSNGSIYSGAFQVAATTTLKVASFDNVGNAEAAQTYVISVDTSAPTVSLTAPAGGAAVGGSAVTISADASDETSVASVDFLVDDSIVGTSTTSPYAITWDSRTVGDGLHSLTARATDSAGNVTTSAAGAISVDNSGPVVNLSAPAAGSTVSGGSVMISADASDSTAVSSVDFLVDGTVVGTDASLPYSFVWNTTTVPDGSHNLTARANDSVGNVTTSTASSVTVDNAGPTISLTAPAEGATVSGSSVALSADASDGSAVAGVEFLVDGTVVGTDTSSPYSINWNTTTIADGSHSLAARATDGVGNVTTSGAVTVTSDNVGPVTALSAPGDGATIGGTTVTISATAVDPSGVTGVDFLVDGNVVGTDSTFPYSINWDSTTVNDGSHSLTARATDGLGTVTTSAARSVTVDNTGPTVSLTGPADASTVHGGSVTISADAYDGTGVTSVEFLIDGTVIGTDATIPYSISWDSTGIADGSHIVSAKVTDSGGNSATSAARSVTVDNTGPTVSLLAPAEGATIGGTSVMISASAADAASVAKVELLVDGTIVASATNPPYSLAWDSTTVADGSHILTARATDAVGNVTTSGARAVTVDNTGPTIALSDPAAGATVSGSAVIVSAIASDGAGVTGIEFLVDGTAVATDATAPYSIRWNSTSIADGSHSLTARATDGLGNIRTSSALSVIVDNSGPSVTLIAPADAATVSGSAVAISATATDPGGISQVEFLVDGTVVATDTTAPYSVSWNSATVAEGTHGLTARATDSLGNITTSASRAVTVRNAPTSALTAPANGATVSGRNVTISATAGGPYAITKVEFYAGATLLATDTAAPYSASWNTNTVLDGTYVLTANATNSVGLATVSASRTVTVRNDTTPPTVSISAPAAGATVSGSSVTISASGSDNVAVARVDFFVGTTLVGTDTTAPYSVIWNSTAVPDGSVSITARATDVNGNSNTSAAVGVTVHNASIVTTITNAGLEIDRNSDGVPDCWAPGGSGNNTAIYARVSDAHSGSFAERLTVTGYRSGSRSFESLKDSGTCAMAVTVGRSYTLGFWYKSTAAISVVVSYRNSSGSWVSWVTSSTSPAATSWTQKTFTTAALPAGATNLSFGINVAANAVVTVDDFSIAIVP